MQIVPIFVPIKAITNIFSQLNQTPTAVEKIFLLNQTELNFLMPEEQAAIYYFLLEYKDAGETLKLYSKELERLILWVVIVEKSKLFNINRNLIIKYQNFLQAPEPKENWCGMKVPKLLANGLVNPKWRPFYKNLSETSIRKVLKIIDAFFNYLVQANYLPGNPLAIKRRRKKTNSLKIIDRYLELDEIQILLEALTNYALQAQADQQFLIIRAKYIILLLFYTGLRISEAAKHTMGNMILRENNWFLAIIGKGKKYREIPIPDELLDLLSNFRRSIGLSYLPEFKETTPLIPHTDLKQKLTPRRIDQILKWAFNIGSNYLANTNPHKASKLAQASAHWLRHSYVTYLLNAGAPLKVAQENAGHSDISTTMLYTHVNQVDKHKATRNLSLKILNNDEES